MLKKILYNKYIIHDIPEELDINSEEFLKILFDLKNVIMFKHKNKLRLLGYAGCEIDWLGRATKFQPITRGGPEVYKIQDKESCVLYQENVLRGSFSDYSFINEDVENYIEMLKSLDKAVILNSKQLYIPFIAKVSNTQQATILRNLFCKIFGPDFKNMIVETKLTDANSSGTVIETTNMQMFLSQIQDCKKKILDEAFLYLGVARPTGKLTHESELEVSEQSQVPDLINTVMFDKLADFIYRCNQKFGLNMSISKKIGG